jgi:phosphohistidine phosphatase SixA
LLDLEEVDEHVTLSNPLNISDNKGYDNQPSFMRGGRKILFTSTRNGQTDIVRYNIRRRSKTWLTNTEGSEYSPVQIGKSQNFSAILLEKDGTQLLYRYNMRTGEGEVLIPGLKIGYHAWIDRHRLISFVLGDPPSLTVSDLKERTNRIIDDTIGRSLHAVPWRDVMSYISKKEKKWTINSYNPETGQIRYLARTLGESDDLAWTPSGTLLTGVGSKLYKLDPDSDRDWSEATDLAIFGLEGITRLAVSPKGKKIAVVVEERCIPSVVYLFRHAEKEIVEGENDPDLTAEGRERSKALAEALKDVKSGVLYSSQYRRTRQTVAPLEKVWSMETRIVQAQNPKEQIDLLFEKHCGEAVLISGHSNTLPNLISLLGITEEITIADDQYGDLFAVRWKNGTPELTIQQIEK